MSTPRYQCEYPTCGQAAVNEITYYDPEGAETYYTERCVKHTYLEESDGLIPHVHYLVSDAPDYLAFPMEVVA